MTDPFEPSRKLDAVDPALQAWGEALTDRISAISGNAQLNAIDAIERLRLEVQADRNDRAQILDYLRRQEAAADELRAGFQSFAETVSGLVIDVDALKRGQLDILARIGEDEARLDAKRARIEALEADGRERRAADAERDREIARVAAALAARPSPEEARATYEGVRTLGPMRKQLAALVEAVERIEQELARQNGHDD